MPYPDTLDYATLTLALVALGVAILSWRAKRHASLVASSQAYSDSNRFILDNWDILGPLTPYKSESKREMVVRVALLSRLNRFRYAVSRRDIRRHINYRHEVMGQSLQEFVEKVERRCAEGIDSHEGLPELAGEVLKAIYENEPYLQPSFWDHYFNSSSWSWGNRDRASETPRDTESTSKKRKAVRATRDSRSLLSYGWNLARDFVVFVGLLCARKLPNH